MTEKSVQEGIQTSLRSMSEFADADIVINDWTILDNSTSKAPYVLIENADEFDSRQDSVTANTRWQVKITLIEVFTKWSTTLNNLRTRRQAIIDKINAVGTARSAGQTATTIDRVYSLGPIGYIYDSYIPEDQIEEALPAYVTQAIGLDVEEF